MVHIYGSAVKAVTKNNDEPGKRKHSLAMPAVHVFDALLITTFYSKLLGMEMALGGAW